MEIKRIDSKESSVCKFVFTGEDYVAESVLYKYPDYKTRTVVCCSTQSGCPMCCTFCGTGNYFVRNLTAAEIVEQVTYSLKQTNIDTNTIESLQIMFMSMGEPLLNKRGLSLALKILAIIYPNAALLISTSAPSVDMTWFNELSKEIPQIGLQFSVHESTDEAHNKLIPFKKKMTLEQIASAGTLWHYATDRKPYFNYCAHAENSSIYDANRLYELFDPNIWEATVSVICEKNEGLPTRTSGQQDRANKFSSKLLGLGYNVRVFNPAGQDDIGGGCGQLWFVQDWIPSKIRINRGVL